MADDPIERDVDEEVMHAKVRAGLFGEAGDPVTIGRFKVLSKVGSGGMGVVYSTYDEELDRRVAIKLLRVDLHGGSQGRTRLLREAQALAKLSHPNVVQVYEVGEHDGQVFIAMEFVKGLDMREWLAESMRPWREVLDKYLEAGRGLMAAHDAGLVHRDFKPDNAIVARDGRVRVLDFGLARPEESPPDEPVALAETEMPKAKPGPMDSPLTQTGTVMGTPAYMAPEQHLGQPADARTDQFCFCVSLYEGLYGERPFRGEKRADLQLAVTRGEVAEPNKANVPGWIRKHLLRGLAPNPAERFADMAELLAALERDPSIQRRRVLTGGALVVLLAGGGFGVARMSADSEDCEPAATRLVGAWDDATRTAVASALADSEWTEVEPQLDEYATEWSQVFDEACAQTRAESSDTRDLARGRLRCLEWRLQELAALAQVLGSAGVAEGAAAGAAERLAGIDECLNDRLIRSLPPPPADPEVRKQVHVLRARLARVGPLEATGRVDEATEIAADIAEQARALDYRPLEAEALRRQGETLANSGFPAEAEKVLLRALFAAEAGADDRVVANGAQYLGFVVGYQLGRVEHGLEHTRRAQAVVERMGGDPELSNKIELSFGAMAAVRGDFETALEHLRVNLEYAPNDSSNDNNVALGLLYLGRLEEAKQHAERGVEADPDQKNIFVHGTLAGALAFLGHHDEAAVHAERAAKLAKARNMPRGFHSSVLGIVYEHAGRTDDALAAYENAVEYNVTARSGAHFETGFTRAIYGNGLLAAGRIDDARLEYERAHVAFEGCCGKDYRLTSMPLTGLGNVLLAEDKAKRALEPLERALALVDPAPQLPSFDAETRFALARALVETGGDRARAIELAAKAKQAYDALGPGFAKRLAAIDAWLAEHGGGE